ncbi:MAG: hypothetical protein B6242_13685 [Anaerolineaceae bacterium 4572_78]|nr:MAG: hypothetical protein B6242_13685 [Anaerolineaceae bacterium 4572_78]
MSKKDLENFLNQNMENTQANVDWLYQRNEWLCYIEQFYDMVIKWLFRYIERGKIQVTRQNITLTEDNIGSYCTEKLILKLANKEISLTPIGIIIGVRVILICVVNNLSPIRLGIDIRHYTNLI